MQQLIKSLPCHSHKPHPPHQRIADVLLLPGEEEDGDEEVRIGVMSGFRRNQQAEVTCGCECPSPRRIVSRILRRLRGRRRPVLWREENDEKSVDGQPASLSSSALDGNDGGGHSESSGGIGKSDESGSCGKGNMFNLGIACSLLYLLASTKDELSKTKQLKINMELFLQDVKEENRRKDSGRDKLMLKESPAASPATSCLTTDLKEVSRCSSLLSCCQSTSTPYLLRGEDSIMVSSRSIVCDEPRKESLEGMEQLEEELEAELERLQLHLDTECFPQSIKVQELHIFHLLTSQKYCPASWLIGNASLACVMSLDNVEAIILATSIQFLNEAQIPVYGGVPPIELERKLHELLESRQQERIKELEAAVECIVQKLSEKEREATLWKDTALLMSQHIPEPTGSSLDAIPGKLPIPQV